MYCRIGALTLQIIRKSVSNGGKLLSLLILCHSCHITLWEEGLGGRLCCETRFLCYDSKKSLLVINFKGSVCICLPVGVYVVNAGEN